MFNSSLEASKCVGARIQTISGIRGQIKKPHGDGGVFRATFEDKILISDVVVLKAWTKVEPKRFCNPVVDVPEWQRLQTIAELRSKYDVPIPHAPESSYGAKQQREERRFNPLKIPRSLFKALPFEEKLKQSGGGTGATALSSRPVTASTPASTAVILSPFEAKVDGLIQRLQDIQSDRKRKKEVKDGQRRAVRSKAAAKVEAQRAAKRKEIKKKSYAIQGARDKRRAAAGEK